MVQVRVLQMSSLLQNYQIESYESSASMKKLNMGQKISKSKIKKTQFFRNFCNGCDFSKCFSKIDLSSEGGNQPSKMSLNWGESDWEWEKKSDFLIEIHKIISST